VHSSGHITYHDPEGFTPSVYGVAYQVCVKMGYCGHLYSSLLSKRTWVGHRVYKSPYGESGEYTSPSLILTCAHTQMLYSQSLLLTTKVRHISCILCFMLCNIYHTCHVVELTLFTWNTLKCVTILDMVSFLFPYLWHHHLLSVPRHLSCTMTSLQCHYDITILSTHQFQTIAVLGWHHPTSCNANLCHWFVPDKPHCTSI